MIRVLALLAACTGCGRLWFDENSRADGRLDSSGDGASATHDEDGDGLPDAIDRCPQIAGTNADLDGDGVGDACDPNPSAPTEHISLFATMQSGNTVFDDNGWLQRDDSLFASIATLGVTPNTLYFDRVLGTVRMDLRFVISAINGTSSDQHQVAIGIERPDPYYFAELNDNTSGPDVGVFSYDDVNGYQPRAIGTSVLLHTGTGVLRIDANALNRAWTIEAGWTGELYSVTGSTPSYDGGSGLRFAANNIDIEITSLTLIETQ